MRWDDGVFLMAQLCSFCGFQPKLVICDTDRDTGSGDLPDVGRVDMSVSGFSDENTTTEVFESLKNIGTRPSIQT